MYPNDRFPNAQRSNIMTKFEVAICMSPNFIVEATNPATTPGMDTAIQIMKSAIRRQILGTGKLR